MSFKKVSLIRNKISDFFILIKQLFRGEKKEERTSWIRAFWSKLRIWLMLLGGLSIFVYLINKISLVDFLNNILNVNKFYFVAALLVGISVTVFKTIRFEFFYPAAGRWLGLYGIFALLRVLYYVLPFNTGEIVYLTMFKKYQFTPTITETAPTWFFLRLTDIIALGLWFTVVLFLVPFSGNLFGEMYSFRWIIIGIAGTMLIVILALPFLIPKLRKSKKENWFANKMNMLRSGFSRTFGMPTLIRTLTISILIWLAAILFDTLALIAFNTPLSFMECFLASIAIYCISLLPINAPLNLGTDEALWTGVLMLAGVSSAQAISIALSLRVVNFMVLFAEGTIGFYLLFLGKAATRFQSNSFKQGNSIY